MNNTQSRDVGIDVYQTGRDIGFVEDQVTVQGKNYTPWIDGYRLFLLVCSTNSLFQTFCSPASDDIGTIVFGVITMLSLLPSIILTFKNVSSCSRWILVEAVVEGLQCLSLLFIVIFHFKHKELSRSSNIFIEVLLGISTIYVIFSWYVMERHQERQRAIMAHECAIEERRHYKEVLFKTSFDSVSQTLADAKDFVEERMADAKELMADTNDIVEESWTNTEYEQTMAHIDGQLSDLANTVAKLQTLASQMIKLRN